MATSPSQQADAQSLPPRAPEEAESVLSSLVYATRAESQFCLSEKLNFREFITHRFFVAVKKCKDSALERQKSLEDEKEQFQKAAYTVLEMLNSRE
ncbi:hypothetical protein GQ457_18G002670 [Hibiscus cannabinus]